MPTIYDSIVPPSEPLAAVVARYREHNDRLEEQQTEHVRVCTLTDLELITRNTHLTLGRALKRIARLEQRVGLVGGDSEQA